MAIHLMDSVIYGHIFGSEEAKAIFDEKGIVESWLLFEKTLAKIQSEMGIIPKEAGAEICHKANLSNIPLERIGKLFQETALVSVALIKTLKEACSPESGEYIHYGPTTQDLYDTSLAIRLKNYMTLLIRDLEQVRNVLLGLAARYKKTLMIGRTHGRQAIPITFGFKMAVLAENFGTHLRRAEEIYPRITIGSLSGAVGTFSSFKAISDANPLELEKRVLEELGLRAPIISVQPTTERFCEFLNFLSLISVSVEKVAQDLFTLQRDEVAEIKESVSDGQIGSSTMPHKQNPKGCEFIIALSKLIRSQAYALMETSIKDERDRSPFWVEDIAVPQACIFTSTILRKLGNILETLEVFPDAMKRNINLSQGLIMAENAMIALSRKTGRKETAHKFISDCATKAVSNQVLFEKILLGDEQIQKYLSPQEIKDALDPANYLGLAEELVEKVISSYKT
jgi:adenylosuccinate lyase